MCFAFGKAFLDALFRLSLYQQEIFTSPGKPSFAIIGYQFLSSAIMDLETVDTCHMFGKIFHYACKKKNTPAPDVDQGSDRKAVRDQALRAAYR